MTIRRILLLAVIFILSSCAGTRNTVRVDDSLYEGLPFPMEKVERPVIPSRTVSIKDFGGTGNGIASNTEAFAKALGHLADKGGGHLIVPEGIWLTGPITLTDNIDLHLEKNAIIIFDPDRKLYPVIGTNFEGLDTRRCESPIHAEHARNVSITGEGVIDGSGYDWRAVKKSKMNSNQWKSRIATGGILNEKKDYWWPDEGFRKAEATANMNVPDPSLDEEEIKSFLRPVMVSFRYCENVLLEGCIFQNSPAWNIHPLFCRNVIIDGITVRNPEYSQNGDGIDIDACTNVILKNSSFDCGDDGICIKSGKDEDGRRHATPCQNLIIDGCTVFHGHGGFVVGSEMSGGVRNIMVSNCRFLGTDVGLRFKSKRGRGGVVEGIWIDNIYMTDIVTDALLFDLFYGGKSAVEALEEGVKGAPEAFPVDETTPAFRDIHISNVVCNGAARAMYFNGLPEMPVKGIHIRDCAIKSRKGIEINCSEDVTIENVKVVIEPVSGRTVRSEMARCPEPSYLDGMKGKLKWNYTTGLELKAFLDVYERYGGEDILKYVDAWYDAIIDTTGAILTYKRENFNTDHVCPARTLFRLYELTGKEKYRRAIELVRSQLDEHPRTSEGGFWHKKTYPYQMWLDGLYMAQPFYAEYTSRYEVPERRDSIYRDICNHFIVVAEHTFDPKTGLYRHAWDESRGMFWCDPGTGQSAHAWGRALGWYSMALVETLPFIPEGTEGRDELMRIFRHIFDVLPDYADPKSGMWYQVLDQPGREGNWLEATCSAMFTYSLLKGVRLGYLDSAKADYAKACWDKLLKEFVAENARGSIDLLNCCAVAGLGGKENRSGDYDYYINERKCANDPKGIGPLVWAALEIEAL